MPAALRQPQPDAVYMNECRWSFLSDISGSSNADLQRAKELLDTISEEVAADGKAVRQAVSELQTVHASLGRSFYVQEAEIHRLQKEKDILSSEKAHLEEEMVSMRERCERADTLVWECDELRSQVQSLGQELEATRSASAAMHEQAAVLEKQTACAEQETTDMRRRQSRRSTSCQHLARENACAEEHTRGVRCKLHRKSTLVGLAGEQEHVLKATNARLSSALEVANRTARSFAACTRENDEVVAELHDQMEVASFSSTTQQNKEVASQILDPLLMPPVNLADAANLDMQVRMQRAELQALRTVREELLNLRDSLESEAAEEPQKTVARPWQPTEEDPRIFQLQQKCKFLRAKLGAMLRHAVCLEQLLDRLLNEEHGAAPSPEAARRLSIQQVHESLTAVFNEQSERLYTLEIQKGDADLELQRLLQVVAEQEVRLHVATEKQDELQARYDETARRLRRPSKGEAHVACSASGTSETKSASECGLARSAASDLGYFLGAASGRLKRSPKVAGATVVLAHAQRASRQSFASSRQSWRF